MDIPAQNQPQAAQPQMMVMDEDEISLGELLNVLAQRKWLIALVFAVVLVAGAAYALLAPPVYQADALIQVEDQKGSALSGLSQLTDFMGLQQNPVAGEIEILRSREVLMKAIRETQANIDIEVDNRFPLIGGWLARRFEDQSAGVAPPLWGLDGYAWGGEKLVFAEVDLPRRQLGNTFYLTRTDATGFALTDEDGAPLANGKVGDRVSFKVQGEDASLAVKTLEGRPGTRFSFVEAAPVQAYGELRKQLDVAEAGKQSNIIRMSFKDTDDLFATELVNAVARAYLEQNVQRRSAEARSSLKFLEQQLPQLKHNVDVSEDALSAYRSRSSTISVDKEAEGLLQQAITLENNRLQLQLKRTEMLQLFKPDHPEVKSLARQIAGVDEAIKGLNQQIDLLPQAQRELLPFERDARVNTDLYISLLNNAQQLRVAEAGTIGNVRIVDYAAHNDKPVEPKKALVLAIAAALGLMLGMLAAFLAHFMRPAIQRSEQIEQASGLSTYLTVPESDGKGGILRSARSVRKHRAGSLLAVHYPQDPAVESLRSLRTGLTFAMMGAPGKVVAVTGATSGVGKSFLASNFATLLADGGKRVVLIDSDMRRPRLFEYFGYERKAPGLSAVLAGAAQVQDVLRTGPVPNLWLLPSGQVPPNPGELLLGPRFGELLDTLSRTHDLIVLDTPPILPVADVLAIMRHVSAAFLVVRAEYSTAAEVRDALAKLRHSGVGDPVKGAIFNGVRNRRLGYGYSYKYYYSYK